LKKLRKKQKLFRKKMTTMHLDIVSAEEEIFSGSVKNIVAAAIMGEVGIYPKHTPMITPLKPGEIKVITENGEEYFIYVSGGVLEVQPDIVTILADTAIRGEDLDEAKAAESKKRAEEALADKNDKIDAAKALAELAQATAQLKMIANLRKKSK
jgi:F-type H+-transporting ATPase subunit epsilon